MGFNGLRVFDLTANKFVYALIAASLSTLQAANTTQALVTNDHCCLVYYYKQLVIEIVTLLIVNSRNKFNIQQYRLAHCANA